MIRNAGPLAFAIMTLTHGVAAALEPATPLAHYARASWTETEGIPSSLVWAITQDRDGYIWLGTDAGLVRFDGVRFAGWEEVSRAPSRISTVRALCATRTGELWVGHGMGGVSRLRDGQLTTYSAGDGAPERVLWLLEDHQGTIWAAGFSGLSRFRGERWQRLGEAQGVREHTPVAALFEDHLGTIWISTPEGISTLRSGSEAFERSPMGSVRDLEEDGTGTMWATSSQHAFRQVSPTDVNRPSPNVPGVIGTRLLRDRHGSIWIASLGQGVVRVSGLEGPAAPVVESLDRERGLSSNVVRTLFEDREGNIWIGTQHGLNRLSEAPIVEMSTSIEETEGVRAVATGQDGSVWVGTENGLYRFADGHRTHYDRRHGLPTLSVGALHSDRNGTLWVATDGGGVGSFVSGRFVRLPMPASAGLTLVEAITTDHEGGVWLCDFLKGVFRWKDGRLTALAGPQVPGKMPFSAMTDRTGRVWIGFVEGTLMTYDNGTLRSYSTEQGLAGGSVSAIFEDRDGTIWAGSDHGLSRFRDGRFAALRREGLEWSSVRGIVQDQDGYLWFGAGPGIARFNPADLSDTETDPSIGRRYTLYDVYDGLRSVPMSIRGYPTAARGGNGRLWFVTGDGIAVLNPQLARNRVPPPVRIERAVADDQVLDIALNARLQPLTSRLQIDYTAFNFSAPARTRFRYRLEGFDSRWIDAATRRQAFYTNLPPGPYRFHVMAGNDGIWTESSAVWEFSVQPAFYQTRWIFVAGALTIGLTVLAAWKLRVRHVKREFALVLAERTRVAREIHDTLLQGLVGVAFQFDGLSSWLDSEPAAAKKRFETLRTQIEMYIREARQSIWDLRSPTLQTRDLPTAIQHVCGSIAGEAVSFEFKVKGLPRSYGSRVEEALLRIAQEAVSNAVRHAGASLVAMELNYSDEALVFRTTDDGHGFDSAEVGGDLEQHWGLASMRERAQLVGGQFTLVSGPGRGTEIEIVVPSDTSDKGRINDR